MQCTRTEAAVATAKGGQGFVQKRECRARLEQIATVVKLQQHNTDAPGVTRNTQKDSTTRRKQRGDGRRAEIGAAEPVGGDRPRGFSLSRTQCSLALSLFT